MDKCVDIPIDIQSIQLFQLCKECAKIQSIPVQLPLVWHLHFSNVFHQIIRTLQGAKGCGSVEAASRFGTPAATGAGAGAVQRWRSHGNLKIMEMMNHQPLSIILIDHQP